MTQSVAMHPHPRTETVAILALAALACIVFQVGTVSGSALGSWCYAAGSVTAIPLVALVCGAVALAVVTACGHAFRAAESS